jgi:hypothetical protein
MILEFLFHNKYTLSRQHHSKQVCELSAQRSDRGIVQDSVRALLRSARTSSAAQCFFTPMRFFDMSRPAKESPQNALAYLNVADSLPHRSEGESVLIEQLPESTKPIWI